MSPAMPRIPRTLYREEHEAYRDMVRRFIAAEVTPYLPQWEEEGLTPRSVWRKAGAAGILGATVPEAYGGSGGDFLFDAVLLEELGRAGRARRPGTCTRTSSRRTCCAMAARRRSASGCRRCARARRSPRSA